MSLSRHSKKQKRTAAHDDESDDDETPTHSQLMKLVKEVRKEVSVSKNIPIVPSFS